MRSVLACVLWCSAACSDLLDLDAYAPGHTGDAITVGTGGTGDGGSGGSASTSATGGVAGMPPSYADAILAHGPIGYWRLGESAGNVAVDAANDFDGFYGAGYSLGEPALITGDDDTAVRLDGTGYITLEDRFDFPGTSSFTLELWVSTDDPAAETRLFNKLEGTPYNGYRFMFDATELRFSRCNDDVCEYVSGVMNLGMAEPTHLAATYDSVAQSICIFIDGLSLSACNSSVEPLPDTSTALSIGFFLEGVVDEVAIYGEALDASAIAQHHALGSKR